MRSRRASERESTRSERELRAQQRRAAAAVALKTPRQQPQPRAPRAASSEQQAEMPCCWQGEQARAAMHTKKHSSSGRRSESSECSECSESSDERQESSVGSS